MSLKLKKGVNKQSAYNLRDPNVDYEAAHTLSIIVDNESGVLARVIGLFSGRGYNIDSLTVAEVDPRAFVKNYDSDNWNSESCKPN